MGIQSLFEKLGLDEKETEIYMTLLKFGPSPASIIATKVSLKRTTIYYSLENLIKKDFVKQTIQHGIKYFIPLDPADLTKVLDNRINKLNNIKNDLKTEIAILQTIQNEASEKPKITYFEGNDGVKKAYNDIITSESEVLEIDLPDDIHKTLTKEWVDDFVQRRIKAKVFLKAIIPETEIGKEYVLNDPKEYRQCMALPAELMLNMHSTISIYDNKINIINLKNSPFGIIIENKYLAETMKTLYNLAWERAEEKIAALKKKAKKMGT